MENGGKNKDRIKVKYEGQITQIDANTLLISLFNLITIVEEINSIISPQQYIRIKINAFEAGSFIVDLELFREALDKLKLLWTHTSTIKQIISYLQQFLRLKQFLGGKKPEEMEKINGSKVQITNAEGSQIVVNSHVFNIYATNEGANAAIKKMFSVLDEDPQIKKFRLEDKENHPLVTISREEFAIMVKENELLEQNKKIITIENAQLSLVKLVFQENRKWEFIYEGNKISAHILDKTFYHRIEIGEEKFAKGDILIVDLEIIQVFDPSVNEYLNKEYSIIRVKKHIRRPEQTKLF